MGTFGEAERGADKGFLTDSSEEDIFMFCFYILEVAEVSVSWYARASRPQHDQHFGLNDLCCGCSVPCRVISNIRTPTY